MFYHLKRNVSRRAMRQTTHTLLRMLRHDAVPVRALCQLLLCATQQLNITWGSIPPGLFRHEMFPRGVTECNGHRGCSTEFPTAAVHSQARQRDPGEKKKRRTNNQEGASLPLHPSLHVWHPSAQTCLRWVGAPSSMFFPPFCLVILLCKPSPVSHTIEGLSFFLEFPVFFSACEFMGFCYFG